MPADDDRTCPAAILWDFDGTIGDTEPMWGRAEARFLADLGVHELPEDAHARVGLSMAASLDQMLALAGRPELDRDACAATITGYVMEIMQAEGIPFRPGALELLARARSRQIPCALVTQTHADVLEVATATLPADTFDVVVSGDQVTHGKPHPEPYLRAVASLGAEPGACLVIEDSPSGLGSAEAAGIPAVGVPAHTELLAGHRQRVVPTLDQVDIDDLCRLWRELSDA